MKARRDDCTTHDMNEANALCDRIAIVDGGKIVRAEKYTKRNG